MERLSDAAWDAQRQAQQWLSFEDRLTQNDSLTRLMMECTRGRQPSFA